ncbi:hypothetical protein BCV23_15740 [Vibrio lentus]|uniref:Uncharacterized protein n=2 Tax=Vibrio lentus TaxID=136468 RepID=A0AA44VRI7_9VIBR|nr:hypothetical protein BCV23_15740 [Vibrio lentus]PMF53202.1 hypothetical protein BCV10_06310 [Vibrio lentus]
MIANQMKTSKLNNTTEANVYANKASKVLATVGLVALALLSVLVVGSSARLLIAQFSVLNAEQELERFIAQQNQTDVDDDSITEAQLSSSLTLLDASMHKVADWDSSNPDSLLLLASYQAVKAGQYSELITGTEQQSRVGYDQAIATAKKAQKLRPMHAKAFVMEAEYQWRNGSSFDQVLAPFELALRNAPYDKSVVLFGLEFYLAYWPQLNVEQKILVSSYLLEPNKYRIPHWQINTIVARSPEKERACRLLNFNSKPMRTCKGS